MAQPIPPHRTRYGTSNPEFVRNELWEQAIAEEWTGYSLRQHLGLDLRNADWNHDFSRSSYRDAVPGPFWSWTRFGRTSTALPDGRVIHVGGEHEDSYDPDFCIYNDVRVDYPGGRREFYLYPQDVFPPTDHHTATLVGDAIILIGALGYRDLYDIGTTQVLRLDTRTLEITRVATTGTCPGWIYRHRAEKLDAHRILVLGGKRETGDGEVSNTTLFELDTRTWSWRTRAHADLAIFPVSADDYRRGKSPVFGTSNPQRVDNPFWTAMVRSGWAPSSARLNFNDPATDGADARSSVVWTACRSKASTLSLADGRSVLIGGRIEKWDDEASDAWIYNDVVVRGRDGEVSIFTYPTSVFPRVYYPVACAHGHAIFVFADVDRQQHPDRERQVVLRLDTRSLAFTPVELPEHLHLILFPGCIVLDGDTAILPFDGTAADDSELGVAFDLATMTWGRPFPHRWPEMPDDWEG